ncbi:MAG: hypothetical protein M1838_001097 [Thelocarpon superellum]|nr:MAG: hypothetical protein M1838_001097 [Thelocarpon superellum]
MAVNTAPAQVVPNRGWGSIVLGASLHDLLGRLKAQPQIYPKLDLSYSATEPVLSAVLVTLPANGFRLRFDGPDQRLRLIEVLDFTKHRLSYKNTEIVKLSPEAPPTAEELSKEPTGPTFRHVYSRLFGPTFPGEYIAPPARETSEYGTYVLSYPGIAFSFPLRNSAWSPDVDFVSLLSSSAAAPAVSMAIFNGSSWPEARTELFTREPPNPRSLSSTARGVDGRADESDMVKIRGGGRIEVVRRSGTPFVIVLSQTTPQDLVAELGPPDAIYRKNDRRLTIHRALTPATGPNLWPALPANGPAELTDTEASSATDGSDNEGQPRHGGVDDMTATECFYNYFHHGFDVFVSAPTAPSPPWPMSPPATPTEFLASNHLTATKVLLHANVPGSYPFNRHRRIRWSIEHLPPTAGTESVDSEMKFDEIASHLRSMWQGTSDDETADGGLHRGMVLNRGWGDSPGSSCELLGGWEENARGRRKAVGDGSADAELALGNTELFGFPGLIFEVLKSGTVSCLTVF